MGLQQPACRPGSLRRLRREAWRANDRARRRGELRPCSKRPRGRGGRTAHENLRDHGLHYWRWRRWPRGGRSIIRRWVECLVRADASLGQKSGLRHDALFDSGAPRPPGSCSRAAARLRVDGALVFAARVGPGLLRAGWLMYRSVGSAVGPLEGTEAAAARGFVRARRPGGRPLESSARARGRKRF